MAIKKPSRAPGPPAARPKPENTIKPDENKRPDEIKREDIEPMPAYATPAQTHFASTQPVEGVTVTGEAVRRVSPEDAEFLIEITASAPTAAQALRDNQLKFAQAAQALQTLGVQGTDLQTISQNIVNLYTSGMYPPSPYQQPYQQTMQALPAWAAAGIQPGLQPNFQPNFQQTLPPEIQFGSWHARSLVRVNVRDTARAGEIVDAVSRAGAIVAGGLLFKASDEAIARRAVLEAAGKDARMRAEALAAAAGKQIGDPISISEELIASNGAYAALRSALPFAFGAGAPRITGELEYYARVSASFRLQ
jgi:uncharacterized protein YggE